MKFPQRAFCFLTALFALATAVASAQVTHLNISQVYGGGGNTGAPYKNDFVELFNPTTAAINTGGYTVQYESSTGTSFSVAATLPSFSLQPGQYFLVGLASGGTPGAALPTTDATGTVNISATVGKIALVNGTTALTSCAGFVDVVGFGVSTVACNETAPTAAPSNTTAVQRTSVCANTNNNSADFAVVAPAPHNSSSTFVSCTSTNPAASLTAAGYPSPTNRGIAHTITVIAKDSSGNTATSYTGTVTITSTDPAAVLPAAYTYTAADAGSHAFTVTLNTTGTQSITATDTTNNFTATQTPIVVNATLWIVNNDTTVSHLGQGGNVLSTAGTASPTATLGGIAVDNLGYAYSVTNSASTVTQFSPTTGALLYTSTTGGLNLPTAISVDGLGYLWVANSNNSISRLATSTTAAPTAVSPSTGYTAAGILATPSAIAIDTTGSVWVANSTGGTVTRFFGAAAPVVTPLVTSVTTGTLGTRP